MELCLVQDICLHQQHQAVVPDLHGPDGLGKTKSPAVLDIVHSGVEPWGAGRPTLRRWRHVDLVATMAYMTSEADMNYLPVPPPTCGTRTLRKCTVSPSIEPTVTCGTCGREKPKNVAE